MNFAFLSRMFRGEPGARSSPAKRDAYCSFCRRSFRDVGPLVEGPGEVYICGACVDLCGAIIAQEKARRGQ